MKTKSQFCSLNLVTSCENQQWAIIGRPLPRAHNLSEKHRHFPQKTVSAHPLVLKEEIWH